jgi:carbonic anhydrase
VIIHHTDCGTTHFTNELVRSALLARNVEAAEAAGVADVDFGAICDLRGSVARDVRFLRGCGLVRETLSIRGFIYDIETGSVEEMGVF